MTKYFSFLATLFSFLLYPTHAQQSDSLASYREIPFYVNDQQISWADSLYQAMSMDERLGQLFMVAAYSNQSAAHENQIKSLIQNQQIGGLIFMQDNAAKQASLTNEYQKLSKVPLLIAMDAEWGSAMRLQNVEKLPYAMMLGAVQKDSLAYAYGHEIARQLKRLGAHMNFGPVVDVNTNPNNPIIGNRSFGSDVENVAQKGIAYTKGMQDAQVLGCAKHFPGHGDTSSDSHKTLPTVGHSKQRLNEIELAPFQKLIDAKVASIMIAHLNVPQLESDSRIPSSLSPKIVTDLLKNKMKFKGLIVTDALNMKGVTNSFPNGETDLRAFAAGNDILLFSQAVGVAKNKIKQALEDGSIPMTRLEESVKKILMAKYAVGLNKPKTVNTVNVLDEVNTKEIDLLSRKIAEAAITVVKNDNDFLPIKDLYQKKIAYVKLEEDNALPFLNQLKKHGNVQQVSVRSSADISKLKQYDYVIIGLHKSDASPYKSYKPSAASKALISKIAANKPSVLCVFTSAYALKGLDLSALQSVLIAYQNSTAAQEKVPEVIFGAASANGKMPVKVQSDLPAGLGIPLASNFTLGYAEPEEVGMSKKKLQAIDNIAQDAIDKGVAPGMQVLVARKGKIVYEGYYGHPTYTSNEAIGPDHIYDVASVTKVTATLPMVMKAVSDNKINVSQTLGSVLPRARNSNKSSLVIKDILGHHAGLVPWIGFYKETVDTRNAKPYLDYYRRKPSEGFEIPVLDNLYLINSFKDTIDEMVYSSKLQAKRYKYSDLSFYLMRDLVEHLYSERLDSLASDNFYKPLNMSHTGYNAYKRFPIEQIVPTEQDKIFRNTLVQGRVHDQGAALMDGVGGHAGLFSTARDMAKLMQMYLNGGYYNGKKFLNPDVINEFTSYHFLNSGSRRGLGFDKQPVKGAGPTCGCTTNRSFGHQGFTGTIVWADPGEELVYIFLSNRVYPDANNNKINKYDVRERIQQVIYDAISDRSHS